MASKVRQDGKTPPSAATNLIGAHIMPGPLYKVLQLT